LSSPAPSLSAVIGEATQALLQHITPLASAAALVVFPVTIWEGALPTLNVGTAGTARATASQARALLHSPWIAAAAVDIVATYFMTAAIIWMVGEALAGREVSAADGYRRVWEHRRALVSAGVVQAVVAGVIGVIAGEGILTSSPAFLMAGGVFAVLVGGYMALTTQVVMREGTGFIAALTRSVHLVRGAFWSVIGLIVIGAVVTALFSTLSDLPSAGGTGGPLVRALSELIAALVAVTVGLFPAALLTAFYQARAGRVPPAPQA